MEAKLFAKDMIIIKLSSVADYDVHKSATNFQKIILMKEHI